MRRSRTAVAAAVCGLAAAAVMVATSAADAATAYYVATNGSSANPGTESRPFATINQFLAVAQPGDTVYVRGGTYSMGETYLNKSGTAGNHITIRNYPGETPVLDGGGTAGVAFYYGHAHQGAGNGSYLTIDGFVIRNYWRSGINIGCCREDGGTAQTVSNVTIRNNVIDRMGQNGITFMFARDITVENNLVGRTGWDVTTGSWSSGINLYGMYGTNNVARRNVSYHNVDVSSEHTDGNGLICDLTYGNGGCRFENNLAFDNGGAGIASTRSANTHVVNNTTYRNGRDPSYTHGGVGIGYYGGESADGAVVKNNIAYEPSGDGFQDKTGKPFTNSTFSNNNMSGQSGAQDPAFVDADNADFRLQSSSPSIDAGTSSGAPGDSITFDHRALTKTSSGQPVSWYRYAPDFAYIAGKGEVRNLFGAVSRPQGNDYDQGAHETAGSGPDSEPAPGAGARTGTGAVRLDKKGTYANLYRDQSVSANTTMVASFWYRGSGRVDLRVLAGTWGAEIAANNECTAGDAWQQCSLEFQTGSNTTVTFRIADAAPSGGTVHLDDTYLGEYDGNNRLTNAGFEEGAAGWYLDATGTPYTFVTG